MKPTEHMYIALACLVFITGCRNKTDWYENFKEKSKSPFGTYILFNESKELFDNQEVNLLKENIYDHLLNSYFDDDYRFNYICVKDNANKITYRGIEELLLYVEDGSTIFLSLNNFSTVLKSTFEIETQNTDLLSFRPSHLKLLKGTLTLHNSSFFEKEFTYDRNLRKHYFSKFNQNNTIVLGTQEIQGKNQPVFIKVYYGKGAVYLHSQPIALTNYNLLNDNYKYAENILSYVPDGDILWDPQIRRSRINSDDENTENSESVFSFFWKHEPLQWFLYLGFFGLIIFILFNVRRKQRPIPILASPKNSTLEFTHTISNLYLLNEDHKNLVQKKIQFFLEKIRSRYHLDTRNLNNEFCQKLASKSGNELQNTKYLINTILALNKKLNCTAEDLMSLHKMIDNFLKKH